MRSWLYFKAFLAFAVVFGAGAVSGSLLTERTRQVAQRKPPCTKSLSERMTAYLVRELELTDRQVKEIQPFVNSACSQMGEIHKTALGEASAVVEECHHSIVPFLSAAQAAKLNVCEAERQRFLTLECGYEIEADTDCSH